MSSSGGSKSRSYEEETAFIHRESATRFRIDKGFVDGMRVPGSFYVNQALEELMFDELRQHTASGGFGGFLPAVKQVSESAGSSRRRHNAHIMASASCRPDRQRRGAARHRRQGEGGWRALGPAAVGASAYWWPVLSVRSRSACQMCTRGTGSRSGTWRPSTWPTPRPSSRQVASYPRTHHSSFTTRPGTASSITPCPHTGGVGFDINCGVRLIRTSLTEKDVAPVKEELTQSLFDHIPVGAAALHTVITKQGAAEVGEHFCAQAYGWLPSWGVCVLQAWGRRG